MSTASDDGGVLNALYNPGITDLELDEHQGRERPVVYLDEAKAAIEALLVRARVDELQILQDRQIAQGWRDDHVYVQKRIEALSISLQGQGLGSATQTDER